MGKEIKDEEIAIDTDKVLADEIADLDTSDVVVDDSDPVKTVVESEEKSEEVSDGEKKEEEIKPVVEKAPVKAVQEDKKVDEVKPEVPVAKDTETEPDQIARLIAEIDRLSGLVKPEETAAAETDDKATEASVETLYDFIKDIDMDDVASDPAVLNKILNEVILRTQKLTTEQVLRSIPQVVMSQVQQQTYLKRTADKFYEDNPDLVNVKKVVRACAQQVQKENPEWEVDKVFRETALKTRQTLGMSARVVNSSDDIASAEDVAFAKPSGGHKTNIKQKKSSRQTEIDEL